MISKDSHVGNLCAWMWWKNEKEVELPLRGSSWHQVWCHLDRIHSLGRRMPVVPSFRSSNWGKQQAMKAIKRCVMLLQSASTKSSRQLCWGCKSFRSQVMGRMSTSSLLWWLSTVRSNIQFGSSLEMYTNFYKVLSVHFRSLSHLLVRNNKLPIPKYQVAQYSLLFLFVDLYAYLAGGCTSIAWRIFHFQPFDHTNPRHHTY